LSLIELRQYRVCFVKQLAAAKHTHAAARFYEVFFPEGWVLQASGPAVVGMALEPLTRQSTLIFQAIRIPLVPVTDINVPAISLAGFGRTIPLFSF
jgi:hypothetical protein